MKLDSAPFRRECLRSTDSGQRKSGAKSNVDEGYKEDSETA